MATVKKTVKNRVYFGWASFVLIGFFLLFLAPFANAKRAENAALEEYQHTASPYFFVENTSSEVDVLPLRSTLVDVHIVGVIAHVKVTQRYENTGKIPLEARYVFPASSKAALHAMEMRLGDRRIVAKIAEKNAARQAYTEAKNAGKTASLLEQARPNVFEMKVANVLPSDVIEVKFSYSELITPSEGVYRFLFPTVVAPRYNTSENTRENTRNHPENDWIQTPYLAAGERSTARFDLQVSIQSAIPIQKLHSPTHQMQLVNEDKHGEDKNDKNQTLRLTKTGKNENNRDFILDYSLAGAQIESGVLLGKKGDENFFLAMIEPPKKVEIAQIVPREYVFIIDVSGSMHGFPLETTKSLMHNLLSQLRPEDRFNFLTFSGGNSLFSPESVAATPDNIRLAIKALSQETGGGGTELLPALQRAFSLSSEAKYAKHAKYAKNFVVITDGFVSVEEDAFQLIAQHLNQANLFAFGIGSSVNHHLIEGMARAGQGLPFIVLAEKDAAKEAARLARFIASPVLTHLKAQFDNFEAYDLSPASIPDVFGERPVILLGKWKAKNTAQKSAIHLTGEAANSAYSVNLPIKINAPLGEFNPVLAHLWARNRVQTLTDAESLSGGTKQRDEIIKLALQYDLLTQYTSFIAIDAQIRNVNGASIEVKQPSPIPEGVGNSAIHNIQNAMVSSTPEPEIWAMLLIASLGFIWCVRQKRRHG